jgi:hypothetical protein
MSRIGLTKAEVRASRDQLLAEGRYPSVDTVRQALGNTGSKSTIHRYLKELAEEDAAPAGARRDDTARSLHAMVEQLADRLHDNAEQRIRTLCAAYEQALQQKERELAELRRTVARLEARVEELEEDRGLGGFDGFDGFEKRQPRRITQEFGHFSSRLSTSRGGSRDISPFSMMSAGARSEVFDVDSMQPSALKFL